MKRTFTSLVCIAAFAISFTACKKDAQDIPQDEITQETLSQIAQLGFSKTNVQKIDEGYLVEGDIILTPENLRSPGSSVKLLIANEEQYHTSNLVTGLPRVVTISVDRKLGSTYINATDEAIRRYNAENLQITFQRIASGGNINIVSGNGNFLASAGFPTSSGAPYGQVKINTKQLNGQPLKTVASVLAHEIGHCIGFRHTDFMNRAYSCGGSPTNEGSSTVGAIHIPGTPTAPDKDSWMLSCIGSGQDRPFTQNDKTALTYLY